MLVKNVLKVSTIVVSSLKISSFSNNVILENFSILSGRNGFTVFQNFLLSQTPFVKVTILFSFSFS